MNKKNIVGPGKDIPQIGGKPWGPDSLGSIKEHVGRVMIDYKMMLKLPEKVVAKFFGVFFPIKAENNFITGIIEYYGYCRIFDEIPKGKMVPTYRLRVVENKDIEFIKMDPYDKRQG